VAHYRFYRMVRDRITQGESHDCADDAAARSRAAAMLRAPSPRWFDAVEIWQGTRLVGRVRREDLGPG
jgi:hypothetical protein